MTNTLTGSYSTVFAQNKLITESGALGEAVTSASINTGKSVTGSFAVK